ncbi:4732_t:CDS:2, partial [Scutellospora calospora]
LEEIVSGDYQVIVKATNNPVLITENMYEILCQVHSHIIQHGSQKQTWKTIRDRWALTSKRAIEVAAYLFDLFHIIGLSSLLVKIINGQPRHPQSQGLVERANGILEQKLSKLKEETDHINDLFERNIHDEEEILDTIDIQCDSDTNLDDDMDKSLSQELNDAKRNSEYLYLQSDNDDNSL